MFMDDDSKTLSKTILDIKNNNGGASKGYEGHNEPTPTNAPSIGLLLLLSYG
jgi:hypothetical protein